MTTLHCRTLFLIMNWTASGMLSLFQMTVALEMNTSPSSRPSPVEIIWFQQSALVWISQLLANVTSSLQVQRDWTLTWPILRPKMWPLCQFSSMFHFHFFFFLVFTEFWGLSFLTWKVGVKIMLQKIIILKSTMIKLKGSICKGAGVCKTVYKIHSTCGPVNIS